MFDLNLYPLYFKDGIEQNELPGMYVSAAPRRTARGRSSDTLIIFLTLLGSAPGTTAGYQPLFERLGKTFYGSSGAVTSALRATAEDLNQILLDRNLKNTQSGKQSIGCITIAAIHGDAVFIAQSGPTHTFVLGSNQLLHYYEAQLAGRGLGLSRTTTLRYYQTSLESGDWLAFSADPPATWNEKTLLGSTILSTEQLRRRLLNQAQRNLRAGLIQFQTGLGRISPQRFPADRVDWNTAAVVAPTPIVVPPAPALPEVQLESSPVTEEHSAELLSPVDSSITEPEPISEKNTIPAKAEEKITEPEMTAPWEPPSKEATPAAAVQTTQPAATMPPQIRSSSLQRFRNLTGSKPVDAETPESASPEEETESPSPQSAETSHPTASPRPPQVHRSRVEWEQRLAKIWRKGGKAGKQGGRGLKTFLARILPDHTDSQPLLSKGQMLLIAIAVPVIIVTIALTTYFEIGRTRQAKAYYLQALQTAQTTLEVTDPTVLRDAWNKTLFLLDKADENQTTDESRALRIQAQNKLDELEDIRRMDYETAIVGGLSPTVIITQIITTSSDMYLLDSAQGKVLHATLTGRGYEVDPTFQCGPGSTGDLIIGKLVDMTVMPRGNDFSADIIAIDATGNVLYCLPNQAPVSAPLAQPDSNWAKITAITIDGNQLYVLDPGTNAVWIYDGVSAGFKDRPRLLFGDEIPRMEDVIDMGVNNQYLYLLHSDGHATVCTFSAAGYEPTRCTDPAPYGDSRPGREPNPTSFADAIFSQVVSTSLPTPSLYLLAPDSRSIYLFSVQLKFQNQYRAQTVTDVPLPNQPATAFYVSANRIAYIAVGNQVYQALMP